MLGRRTLAWLGRRQRKLLREQSSSCSKELSVLRSPFYEGQCLAARPITTETSTIKVEELTIPMPWGDIAAKKWTSTETESSEEENVKKRPLVALHGWLDNAASYDGLAPLLPLTRYDLISLDLPGL